MKRMKMGLVLKTMRHAVAVCKGAVKSFLSVHGAESAAAIAFFTLFSLFPLLLLLVSISSFFAEGVEARSAILSFTLEAFPAASRTLIEKNLSQVLKLRGSVSLVGTAGLLWSATAAFSALSRNINRAWRSSSSRGIIATRLAGLLMAAGFLALILAFFLFDAILGAVDFSGGSVARQLVVSPTVALLSGVLVDLLAFLALLFMYRWVPRSRVHWSEAAGGAVGAFVLARLLSAGFAAYLRSGLARYNLVYGSLGTVVSMLLWTFGISIIVLWGAHLSAAIHQTRTSAGGTE